MEPVFLIVSTVKECSIFFKTHEKRDLENHQIFPSYSLDGRTTWTSLSTIFLQSTKGLVMDDIGYFGLGAGYDSGSFTAIYKNISIDGESF